MAYDAEIRIGTSVDTSQMQKLQIQINKTTDKVAQLSKAYDDIKNKKIPTEEFSELETKINSVKFVLEELNKAKKDLNKQGIIGSDEDKRILKIYGAVRVLKQELEKATINKDQNAYLALEDKLNRAKSVLTDLMAKNPRPLGKLAYYESITEKIKNCKDQVEKFEREAQKLTDEGKAFKNNVNSEELEKASKSLEYAKSELRALNTKQDEMIAKQQKAADKFTTLSKKGQKTYRGLASVIKGGLIKSFDTLKDKASKSFKSIHSGAKKSSGLFTDMKNRLKGIALSLFVFNWITKAFNSMVSGINEGLKNLAGVSEETNKKMSELKTSLTYLKNSFTAAFAPILETVIPVLTTLMNTLSNAINYVGMFFAALTGKSSYYKAKKVQEDYTESLEDTTEAAEETKEALGGLAGFDDIDLLPTQTDTGNKDKDKDKDKDKNTEDMFEEVPIASDLQNLADRLKDLIEKGDWESIGSLIAEKLNGAMQNIQWDSIQESARNVAVNIANFINGFVKTFDWSLLGYNIAQGLNTALTFLNTLITTLDWGALGAALYNCLNSIVLNFDWSLLGQTLANGINGVFNFLYTAITGFDFAKLAASITTFINTAVTEIDWQLVAATIGEGINALLSFIVTFITTLDWGAIGEAIYTSVITFLSTLDFGNGIDFSSLISSFDNLLKSIEPIIGDAADGLLWLLENVLLPLAAYTIEDLLPAFLDLLAAALDALREIIEALAPLFTWLWDNMLQPIAEWTGGVIVTVIETLVDALKAFSGWCSDNQSLIENMTIIVGSFFAAWKIVELVNNLKMLIGTMVSGIANIAKFVSGLPAIIAGINPVIIIIGALIATGILLWKNWDTISAKAKQIWGKIKETIGKAIDGIIGFFKGAIEFIKGLFTKDWTESFGVLGHVLNAFFENAENVFEDVKQIFEGIVDFITGVFSGDWEKAISGLVNIFAGVWGLLTDIAKAPINIIIGFINTMIDAMIGTINFFIESLNKLSFDVPDWVPLIGGKKFGFNFTTVSAPQIPYLAQGAVIPPNQQFLAMLGDQTHGRNLEAPEGLIRQIFREESSSNQMPANITLKFSGDLSGLARLLKPELDAESSRLGISLVTDIG